MTCPHKKYHITGSPQGLTQLDVWLQLRSWSHGSWVSSPRQALCWQLRVWSLLRILSLPVSLPLPYSWKVVWEKSKLLEWCLALHMYGGSSGPRHLCKCGAGTIESCRGPAEQKKQNTTWPVGKQDLTEQTTLSGEELTRKKKKIQTTWGDKAGWERVSRLNQEKNRDPSRIGNETATWTNVK